MSKKQLISLLLALVMLFSCVLTACNNSQIDTDEISSEASNETLDETTSETEVVTTIESSEETTAETTVETTSETEVMTTIESSEETTAETTVETTTETEIDTTIETSEETTVEITDGTTTETEIDTTIETMEETTVETTDETTTETEIDTTIETSEETTLETTDETTTETEIDTTIETSEETTVETTDETTTEIEIDTTIETTEETTVETTDETTTETEIDTTIETTEVTTAETTEETTEETEEETEVITDVMVGETIEAEYAADFSVSRVFSDNMVVQRNEHIRVWGFAPESENGKKVSGEFKGMFAEALIENGEWCLTFGARLEADTVGAEMTIYTDEKEVVFSDVLVGDVYMVIGQSNVEAAVGSATPDSNDAIIRLNRTNNSSGGSFPEKGTDYVYKDLVNPKQWTKATASEIAGFSAIGYYFAKEIVEKTNGNVPVGVIEMGFSGAPLGSYLPNEIAEKYDTDVLTSAGTYLTTGVNANASPGRFIYNCHIAPFEKYAMAGLIWYQGESNNSLSEASKYNEIFAGLITYMRSTHNLVNKDFPVFIMDFPSIYQKPAGFNGTWHFMELGIIRSYMGSIPTILKNSYVSVSNDLWADREYFNSLHPTCKPAQAERLAMLADAVIYKNGSLENATGPIFKSAEISEDKKTVVITFTNVGEGLRAKDGGIDVLGIVGLADKPFAHETVSPVSAKITAKDQITVTFNTEVKAVAYNYASEDYYGETINLCNASGCPASAFISPYEETDLESFKSEDFYEKNANILKYKGYSIDTLSVDGVKLFEDGKVIAGLNNVGYTVKLTHGTAQITTAGWIGFGYETLLFGYSIDESNAVFNTYPSAPGQAVINAGGEYAQRFTINANISNLAVGEHTINYLALVEIKDRMVAVKVLSFTIVISEPEAPPVIPEPDVPPVTPDPDDSPVIPEGLDVPMCNESGYGYIKYSFDLFSKDGTKIYTDGSIAKKLEADGNLVTVAKGTKQLRLYGWIGFTTALDKFGYAVDGNAVITTDPQSNPSSAIIQSGGEYARRYDVFADISGLDVGYHTFDLLVRIHTSDGGTAVLKIISFTILVTE